MIKKPMLAESILEDQRHYSEEEIMQILSRLRYPLLVTPKLDGIRTLLLDGKAVSRSLKRVPNIHTRTTMESTLPNGVDGEFYIEGETFNNISGAWRRESGKPDFIYYVFDYVLNSLDFPYENRMDQLRQLALPSYCVKLLPLRVETPEELLHVETDCLEKGFEGVMLRHPTGPYKCGRSTLKEGWLLKFKRFYDGEAEVIGFEELMRNKNEAITNALGHTERSTHKANMVKAGTLGSLLVRGLNVYPGVEFSIGTGMDVPTRNYIWEHREVLLGQVVNFSYQEVGTLNKPRFPKFRGFRDRADM